MNKNISLKNNFLEFSKIKEINKIYKEINKTPYNLTCKIIFEKKCYVTNYIFLFP